MKIRSVPLHAAAALSAVAAALLVPPARASDPPHWANSSGLTIDCSTGCHQPHTALGNQLTSLAGNANVCQSCHVGTGSASTLPVNTSDKANLTTETGIHHGWDVTPVSGAVGTVSPTDQVGTPGNQTWANRLSSGTTGNIVCSTCHDQHAANHSGNPADTGLPRISPAKKTTAFTSPLVTSTGTYSGAGGAWYLVEISTAGAVGTSRFRYSKDNGVTWFASNLTTAASVVLDSGVIVGFPAGSYVLNERYEFNASWPFLRKPLDSGDNTTGAKFCRNCHSGWAMDHTAVETYTGTTRSHPVGVALNANGRGYDRTTPLDANGAAQTTGDGNAGNDLRLDASGMVQCWSCHAAHYSQSNSAAVIP